MAPSHSYAEGTLGLNFSVTFQFSCALDWEAFGLGTGTANVSLASGNPSLANCGLRSLD
jgi:hypothetical protein